MCTSEEVKIVGTAYFKDGHTEAITDFVIRDNGSDIEFQTTSGRYFYKEWGEPEETLFFDNNPIVPFIPKHMFYQKVPVFENTILYGYIEPMLTDWRIIPVEIEKIEILTNEEATKND